MMPFSPCDPSQPTCDDVTVNILQHIFGPIIDALVKGVDPNTVTSSSNLLAALFSFFNSGILVVGSIIISYVAVMGAINTANDGEVMGKMWSTVWTPVRIIAGASVLLPSTSGYSFIQMFVLTIALWSIGFANGIYKLGMGMGVFKPDGIVATSYQTGTYFGMRDFAKQYLAAAYCARVANTIYGDAGNHPRVMVGSSADKKSVTGTRTNHIYFIKDRNTVTNLSGGEPVCGTVMLTTYSAAGTYSDTSGAQGAIDSIRVALAGQKLKATTDLMADIDKWVTTLPSDVNQLGWNKLQSDQFNTIIKTREDQVAKAIVDQMVGSEGTVNTGLSAFIDSLTKEGWAMAGGWYQRVGVLRTEISKVTSETIGSVSYPSLNGLPDDANTSKLKLSISIVADQIPKKAELNGKGYKPDALKGINDISSTIPKDPKSAIDTEGMINDWGTKASNSINALMKEGTDIMTGSSGEVDAISRMKLVGDLLSSFHGLLMAVEFTIKTGLTIFRVIAGVIGTPSVLGNSFDPTGVTDAIWDLVMTFPIPILADIATYVGLLAFYFGVALPSLPYTVYMITVVGWLLGVLQAIIAAPLWAIMHMRPSQTFIGSEAQGYLLLMALFVRPALAVIGLFAAMLVADPVVDYIAKAFFAMRGSVASSTGWLGVIAQFNQFFWWFAVFGALLFPILFTIFSLPQVLPDRVLAWLNVGAHDLGATTASGTQQSMISNSAEKARSSMMGKLGGGDKKSQEDGNKNGDKNSPNSPDGGGKGGGRGGGRGGKQPINANSQGVTPNSSGSGQGGGQGGGKGGGSGSGGLGGGQGGGGQGGDGLGDGQGSGQGGGKGGGSGGSKGSGLGGGQGSGSGGSKGSGLGGGQGNGEGGGPSGDQGSGKGGGQGGDLGGGQGSGQGDNQDDGQDGGQGADPKAASTRRKLRTRMAEGLGVAIGRTITDVGGAIRNKSAGGASSLAGRFKDAIVTAGSEGVAAYREGADSRIAHFKADIASRKSAQASAEGQNKQFTQSAQGVQGTQDVQGAQGVQGGAEGQDKHNDGEKA